MEQPQKSIQTAYKFWVFSGLFAGHRFYIGGWPLAWNLFFLNIGAIVLFIMALGFEQSFSQEAQNSMGGVGVLLALFGIFLVIADLAMIPGFVRAENEETAERKK